MEGLKLELLHVLIKCDFWLEENRLVQPTGRHSNIILLERLPRMLKNSVLRKVNVRAYWGIHMAAVVTHTGTILAEGSLMTTGCRSRKRKRTCQLFQSG